MPKKQTTNAARARAAARAGGKYSTALRQQQAETPGTWHGTGAEPPSESGTAVSVPKWLSLEIAQGQIAQQQLANGGPALSSWHPGMTDDVNPICGCHLRARCAGCGVCTTCDGCYCGEYADDAAADRQEREHYEHREHDPECYSCETEHAETAGYTRCPKCQLAYPDGRADHIAHNPAFKCWPLSIWPTSTDWTYLIGQQTRFVGKDYDVNGLVLDDQPRLQPGAYYPHLRIMRTDPGYEGESPINPREWREIHPAPPTPTQQPSVLTWHTYGDQRFTCTDCQVEPCGAVKDGNAARRCPVHGTNSAPVFAGHLAEACPGAGNQLPPHLAPKAAAAITPGFLQSCTDPKRALNRACEITTGSGGAFWDSVVRSTLQAYLVAAAISGATPETLAQWVTDPDNPAPAEILRSHPAAPAEMHLQFEAIKGDGQTQATVRMVVQMALLR